jgi:hypothetical protein
VFLPADDTPAVILLNPWITDRSWEKNERYEAVSAFRSPWARPSPTEDHGGTTTLACKTTTAAYELGLAHLIHNGIYRTRRNAVHCLDVRQGIGPIPCRSTPGRQNLGALVGQRNSGPSCTDSRIHAHNLEILRQDEGVESEALATYRGLQVKVLLFGA